MKFMKISLASALLVLPFSTAASAEGNALGLYCKGIVVTDDVETWDKETAFLITQTDAAEYDASFFVRDAENYDPKGNYKGLLGYQLDIFHQNLPDLSVGTLETNLEQLQNLTPNWSIPVTLDQFEDSLTFKGEGGEKLIYVDRENSYSRIHTDLDSLISLILLDCEEPFGF